MREPQPPSDGLQESSAPWLRGNLDLNPLRQLHPELSNAHFYKWNAGGVIVIALFAALIIMAPRIETIALGLFIFCATQGLFHWVGLILPLTRRPSAIIEKQDGALLSITLLFPVYDEAAMMPQLARVMAQLDYPADKCDIKILVEQKDLATITAFNKTNWPSNVRLCIVPAGSPQTKPRACNYGLALSSSQIIGVFDAEDRPHRNILREVSARFSAGSKNLACLQAPLVVTDYSKALIAYLFAVEYAMQFRFLLPAWLACKTPAPLSGAANFFRTETLREVGAWDANNLTEDADLGIRLARFGYHLETLQSPCFETAPETPRDWFFQRTRWYTGHIQTLLVHLRTPVSLFYGVGLVAMVLFLTSFTARIFTSFAHGFFLIILAANFSQLVPYLMATPLGWLSLFIYCGRFFCYLHLFSMPAMPRPNWKITVLPLYWLAQIPALLLAIYNVSTRNMKWYKTPHQPITDGFK